MKGIVLAFPHGDLLIEGSKTLIIKDIPLSKELGENLTLLQGDIGLGIIKLISRERMSVDVFSKYDSNHRISDNERRRWWEKSETLWGFEFKLIERWDPPRRVFREKALRTIVPDIVFKGDDYYKTLEMLFKDEGAYDERTLMQAHRLIHVFYERRSSGDKVVIGKSEKSVKDIIERHVELISEMSEREIQHGPPDDDLNGLSKQFAALVGTASKKGR